MSNPKLKVLISGAGIAGTCLAYWLARTRLDVSITVVERSPSPRLTGQAIDIRGPAIEIIKRMGLEEAIRAVHTTEEGTEFINSSGKAFAKFDTEGTFTAEYEILRADLCRIFVEATEKSDRITYIYGDSIQSLEQTADGVNVTFTKRSKGIFDVVAGADGSASKTRSMILDEQLLADCFKFWGQYIAFFSIPSRPTDPKRWRWYTAPKGLSMMMRPHRNPSTMGAYLTVTMPAREQRDPALEKALDQGWQDTKRVLHDYFQDAGWEATRILEGMDNAEDFYMARAAQVKLPKWTNGRALVLGDAAFATFGIGTSLAIESAYVLAGELSKIKSTNDVPQALEKYEEVFRTLYSKFSDIPSGFPQLASPQTGWGLRVRDSVIWLFTKSRMYKLVAGLADGQVKWTPPSYDWLDS